jgi:23S rRNA G2445 N2-methylase RlmL
MKYKLNIARDVDVDGHPEDGEGYGSYILNLPYGFCFDDDASHVKGFDTMADVRKSVKLEVRKCICTECKQGN